MKSEDKISISISAFGLIVSFVALIISIAQVYETNQLSERANEIAREATELSKAEASRAEILEKSIIDPEVYIKDGNSLVLSIARGELNTVDRAELVVSFQSENANIFDPIKSVSTMLGRPERIPVNSNSSRILFEFPDAISRACDMVLMVEAENCAEINVKNTLINITLSGIQLTAIEVDHTKGTF